MWGTWWVWDARLTSELILLFLYIGFMALQSAIDEPRRAARAGAVLALIGVINLPVIHYSVEWWNTLHQPASVARMDGPRIQISPKWKKIERKYYNKLRYPDRIFLLLVDENEAISRKNEALSERKQGLLREKIFSVNQLAEKNNNRFIIINTLNGKDETLGEIKRKVWEYL